MLLVTGSAGYVASYLIPALKERGHDVLGIDREQSSVLSDDEQILADLTRPDTYANRLEGVSSVLHLAAAKGDWGISDEEYYRDNVEATKALIDVARAQGIRNWHFYSTVSALGPSSSGAGEEATPAPTIAYGRTKLECEEMFTSLAASDPEASISILRPSVVFGPGNPWNTNIYRLIDAIYKRRFVMVGPGDAIKTTSYIENLVAASLFLMKQQERGVQIFHYVDEPLLSTGALVDLIRERLGKSGKPVQLPLGFAKVIASVADIAADLFRVDLPITSARIQKFCTATNFSSEKIRSEGFQQPVSVEDALSKTVQWYSDTIARS